MNEIAIESDYDQLLNKSAVNIYSVVQFLQGESNELQSKAKNTITNSFIKISSYLTFDLFQTNNL